MSGLGRPLSAASFGLSAGGTQVEITISAKRPEDPTLAAARDRLRELFRTIKGFRNAPRIPREELYERGSLR